MATAKTTSIFQMERDLATAKAAYHEASEGGNSTTNDLAKMAEGIEAIQNSLSEAYATGAKTHCDTTPTGFKRRAGLYEVTCPDCGVRAQGDQPEAAVYNFNEGEFYTPDPDRDRVGTATTSTKTTTKATASSDSE